MKFEVATVTKGGGA